LVAIGSGSEGLFERVNRLGAAADGLCVVPERDFRIGMTRDVHHGEAFGPQTAEGDFEEPQRAARARLGGRDHPAFSPGSRNERDHAPDEEVQDLRLALVGTVHGRRGRGPAT